MRRSEEFVWSPISPPPTSPACHDAERANHVAAKLSQALGEDGRIWWGAHPDSALRILVDAVAPELRSVVLGQQRTRTTRACLRSLARAPTHTRGHCTTDPDAADPMDDLALMELQHTDLPPCPGQSEHTAHAISKPLLVQHMAMHGTMAGIHTAVGSIACLEVCADQTSSDTRRGRPRLSTSSRREARSSPAGPALPPNLPCHATVMLKRTTSLETDM